MRKNCSEIQKFETPEVAQKLPCTARTGLHNISLQCGLSHRSLSCIPESGAKHFFIRPYDIIFRPHELKDMYSIFLRAKRLDLQAKKKKKKKKPEMGKISESHLQMLTFCISQRITDILSFLLEMPSFLEKKKKKKKRFPCLFQKRCWYQKNVEEGLGIG